MAYTPSYVNFSRYLDANRGAASSAAQGLADDVTQQGAELDGQLNGQVNDFNAASTAGTRTVQPHSSAVWNAQGYTGPQSLSQSNATGYTDLLSKADSLGSKASDLGNEAGVRTALQAKAGSGPYSTGASRFDGALVNAAGAPALSDAATRYGTLSQRVRDADTASGATAAANTVLGDQNLAAQRAQEAQYKAAPKTITQRGGTTREGLGSLMPETTVQNNQRMVAPLGNFNQGAASAVQNSLKNYDTYRGIQERNWNRDNNPLGKTNTENPFTEEHIGKRRELPGKNGWR